ncbi:MAG: flagellar basal body rod protein FlgB [Bdellovibrionales bacterium CG10_big_fil_rev_8_21_14_0_10_45_34]|nr:MAG: flagellar basal body rod protein FlgB [Bdellovibrionales bacterium CG10_big_fil_rev_8_21_14_0_10_45_34]
MNRLYDKTIDGLSRSLDLRLARHGVTTSNIANAETPGYKAKKVDFEAELKQALDLDGLGPNRITDAGPMRDHQTELLSVKPDVYDNPDAEVSPDGNSVNLEREMVELAENNLLYQTSVELMRKKLGQLKYAISEGGR